MDITFGFTATSDGGILIRGIRHGDNYINGPLRVMRHIFELFGSVDKGGSIQLQRKDSSLREFPIYKTTRHGLGKSVLPDFKRKPYRYYLGLEYWDTKHVSKANKEKMKGVPLSI